MDTTSNPPNIRSSWILPSKGVNADPLVMPLAFAPAGTFPKPSLCGCLFPGFNPGSTIPSCFVGGPVHSHSIPKDLSVVVEVLLGISWLFPCNTKLFSVLQGVGQAAELQLLHRRRLQHKVLTFFHQMMKTTLLALPWSRFGGMKRLLLLPNSHLKCPPSQGTLGRWTGRLWWKLGLSFPPLSDIRFGVPVMQPHL